MNINKLNKTDKNMKNKRYFEAVKRFEAAVEKLMKTPGWEQALLYELGEAIKNGKLKRFCKQQKNTKKWD